MAKFKSSKYGEDYYSRAYIGFVPRSGEMLILWSVINTVVVTLAPSTSQLTVSLQSLVVSDLFIVLVSIQDHYISVV